MNDRNLEHKLYHNNEGVTRDQSASLFTLTCKVYGGRNNNNNKVKGVQHSRI